MILLLISAKLGDCLRDSATFTEAVHAWKNLVHERHFTRAASFARAITLNYLVLHVRSKICVSKIQSFLLLKHVKCLIWDKTG